MNNLATPCGDADQRKVISRDGVGPRRQNEAGVGRQVNEIEVDADVASAGRRIPRTAKPEGSRVMPEAGHIGRVFGTFIAPSHAGMNAESKIGVQATRQPVHGFGIRPEHVLRKRAFFELDVGMEASRKIYGYTGQTTRCPPIDIEPRSVLRRPPRDIPRAGKPPDPRSPPLARLLELDAASRIPNVELARVVDRLGHFADPSSGIRDAEETLSEKTPVGGA